MILFWWFCLFIHVSLGFGVVISSIILETRARVVVVVVVVEETFVERRKIPHFASPFLPPCFNLPCLPPPSLHHLPHSLSSSHLSLHSFLPATESLLLSCLTPPLPDSFVLLVMRAARTNLSQCLSLSCPLYLSPCLCLRASFRSVAWAFIIVG